MHDDLEAAIARIGAAQHGVVTMRQLEDAGIPRHRIRYCVKRGRIRPLCRGVYRTGASPTFYEREIAAVLTSGDGAVLSHRSAAVLWGLVGSSPAAPVDVTITRGRGTPANGVRVHRTRRLPAEDIDIRHGIPLTDPVRTILDLAPAMDVDEIERVVASAYRSGLATPAAVHQMVRRHRSRPGVGSLRRVLERTSEPMLTRSQAEILALSLFRKAALEAPSANALVEGYEVDFLWAGQRVVVEVDGFAFHSTHAEFERDRLRDATLAAAGYRVIRITWRQLRNGQEALIARLAATLARQVVPDE